MKEKCFVVMVMGASLLIGFNFGMGYEHRKAYTAGYADCSQEKVGP